MSDEYADLSYMSEKRTPITASLYYFDRWKIMQCKLLLNDLLYLQDKHNIISAGDLYLTVQEEADTLCRILNNLITGKQTERRKYIEPKKTV